MKLAALIAVSILAISIGIIRYCSAAWWIYQLAENSSR